MSSTGSPRNSLRARGPPSSNPVGQVLTGRAGAGKTHLLGALRRRVWEGRGWFVLIDMIGINDFWRTAALGFLQSLSRVTPGGRPRRARS